MGWRWLVLKVWTAMVYVFLFLPIVTVVFMSFNVSKYSIFPPPGMTTRWYVEAAQDPNVWFSIKNSLFISVCASIGATTIGTLAAMGFVRNRFRLREVLSVLFLSPMIIPEIITGIALLSLATLLHIKGGYLLIIIGHILVGLPFVMTVVSARLHGFDASLEEAAMDLGARPLTVYLWVTLPLIAPALVAGWLLAFTLSLDDLVIASFVAGPGSTTLPMVVYSSVRMGVSPQVNALATLIVLFVTVAVVATGLVLRGRRERQD